MTVPFRPDMEDWDDVDEIACFLHYFSPGQYSKLSNEVLPSAQCEVIVNPSVDSMKKVFLTFFKFANDDSTMIF